MTTADIDPYATDNDNTQQLRRCNFWNSLCWFRSFHFSPKPKLVPVWIRVGQATNPSKSLRQFEPGWGKPPIQPQDVPSTLAKASKVKDGASHQSIHLLCLRIILALLQLQAGSKQDTLAYDRSGDFLAHSKENNCNFPPPSSQPYLVCRVPSYMLAHIWLVVADTITSHPQMERGKVLRCRRLDSCGANTGPQASQASPHGQAQQVWKAERLAGGKPPLDCHPWD